MPTIYIATVTWNNDIDEEEQITTVVFLADNWTSAVQVLITEFGPDINQIKDLTPVGQGYVIDLGHSDKTDIAVNAILEENSF